MASPVKPKREDWSDSSNLNFRNNFYSCTLEELSDKQNLLAMEGSNSTVGGWETYKDLKHFRGVVVNNEGSMIGFMLKPVEGTEDVTKESGLGIFGENYEVTTFDKFSFPTGYNSKRYFRDIIHCNSTNEYFLYDDKNKAVLKMQFSSSSDQIPSPGELSLEFVGELNGPMGFGKILKVSQDCSLLYANEGGKRIKIFRLDTEDEQAEESYIESESSDRLTAFEPAGFNRLAILNQSGLLTIFNEEGISIEQMNIFQVSENTPMEKEFTRTMAVSDDFTNIAVTSYTTGMKSCRIFWLQLDQECHLHFVSEFDVSSQLQNSEIKSLNFIPNVYSSSTEGFDRESIEIGDFTLTGNINPCESPKKQHNLMSLDYS